ncbi:hypothetical protein [Ralstonia phage RSP15]|uniref:hypothetical protein n=1 Tax=Ralstonia phage RSP15 TaxID=1785960 RepID=UPI00074D3E77|nr:hypothetical protein BH754_gp031 [Ralstonia phage RSP15]BAU39989.1 hypothetical protein [Ralstonia phage RSP15]
MRLLTERMERVETLVESTSSGKVTYIEGPFLMAEAKNRNGRVYPKSVMEKAVSTYMSEYVDARRAIGELNHPAERPFADPALAALMVEKLEWQGNVVIGKARILNNPHGAQIKSLLEANFNLGVSSRGLGKVVEQNGQKTVSAFVLNAIDAVDQPSGQVCYVNAVNESAIEWINEGGVWRPVTPADVVTVSKDGTFDEAKFFNNLDRYIETLKKAK